MWPLTVGGEVVSIRGSSGSRGRVVYVPSLTLKPTLSQSGVVLA